MSVKHSWNWTFFSLWSGITLGIAFWYQSSDRCSWPQKQKCPCEKPMKKCLAFELESSFRIPDIRPTWKQRWCVDFKEQCLSTHLKITLPLERSWGKSSTGICRFQTSMLIKLFHLKITLPLGRTCGKSSTVGVWVSNGVHGPMWFDKSGASAGDYSWYCELCGCLDTMLWKLTRAIFMYVPTKRNKPQGSYHSM